MGQRYITFNGAMPTTAPLAKVTTGTATKTLLQIATSAGNPIWVEEWGISFDGTASATPIQCELVETGSVAATVTAHVAAGVQPYDRTSGTPVSTVTLGTTATGYTSTAEGTITATRYGDYQIIPIGVSQLTWEWSLGREFEAAPSRFLRVRMTTSSAVAAYTYVLWDE